MSGAPISFGAIPASEISKSEIRALATVFAQ